MESQVHMRWKVFRIRVGKCTFLGDQGELRGAKGTYTAEYFVALQKINHTKLVNQDGETRNFTEEERRALTFAVIHTEGSEVRSSSQEVRFAGGYSFL